MTKQLIKHNPVRIAYLCKHGHCKWICDMKVEERITGEYEVILGARREDGGFTPSHFIFKRWTWATDSFIVEGSTPSADASIELKFISRHFLEGTLQYCLKSGGGKEFPIHVHLDHSDTERCTEKFEYSYHKFKPHIEEKEEHTIHRMERPRSMGIARD